MPLSYIGKPISVAPKKRYLLALPLIPVAVGYATFIIFAIARGIPKKDSASYHDFWMQLAITTIVVSALWIGWSLWVMASRGVWYLDETGLKRGRIAPILIPWTEIQSMRVGMPSRRHFIDRLNRSNPKALAKATNAFTQRLRDESIVLALQGNRVIAINVRFAKNGEAFMGALTSTCEPTRIASEFSDQEASVFARVRCFNELMQL